MTAAMRELLRKVHRRTAATGGWYRAETAGERVTLAALDRRGFCKRRAWRGDGVSRDSAFEYRVSDGIMAALAARRRGEI